MTATTAGQAPAIAASSASRLVCAGCETAVPAHLAFVARCPASRPGDDTDHVLRRVLDHAQVAEQEAALPNLVEEPDPFLRYRARSHAWQVAHAAGWSDDRFVELVGELDEAIARVDGHGFRVTPLLRGDALGAVVGTNGGVLWLKDETGDVSGSHKARHLMGVMLALRTAESLGQADPDAPLAIASCGNAALAAGVVARAAERALQVFVPPDAPPAVVARLRDLGAAVEVCARQPGEVGDPTVKRLLAAIDAGAVPFTVQGNLDGLAIEGGATLGWELLDGIAAEGGPALDRLVVHVGGGAFASALALACEDALALGQLRRLPRLDTVQTRGAYPLARAHERVLGHLGATAGTPLAPARISAVLTAAARHRSAYMWPWESQPRSIAHGILDDETYDWLAVVRAMLRTGGRSVVVDEAGLREANDIAVRRLGSRADHTGTAGLAGLIAMTRDGLTAPGECAAVVLSGIRRESAATDT